MADRYVRSAFWLCAWTGLGVVLLKLITPSEDKLKRIQQDYPGIEKNPKEVHNKNQQFINVLQAATENSKPFYRMSKKEIEEELKKH